MNAWMRRNDDVQDERYVVNAWMRRNDDVQVPTGCRPITASCVIDISAFRGGRR